MNSNAPDGIIKWTINFDNKYHGGVDYTLNEYFQDLKLHMSDLKAWVGGQPWTKSTCGVELCYNNR